MSPAGVVTGSSYAAAGLDPGVGWRNWEFKGTPLDRFGSSTSRRRIRSQIPTEGTVYFCDVQISGGGGGGGLRGLTLVIDMALLVTVRAA